MNSIYYESGSKQKIYLDQEPFWLQTGDFLNYKWPRKERNNRIVGFKKEITEKEMLVSIFGKTETEYAENCAHIHETFEKDICEMTPGKLYFGDYYLKCYIFASEKSGWEYGCNMHDSTYRLVTDHPSWIKELKKQFLPQAATESMEGMDFPFDFPFDFAAPTTGQTVWNVDHYTSSHFLMTIYGPCVDPIIHINGYPYQIHTILESGDYLTVDSRVHEVMKHLSNGTKENLYNSRAFTHSVFEKIPSGNLQITWPGTFGYDITLFLERSEPR